MKQKFLLTYILENLASFESKFIVKFKFIWHTNQKQQKNWIEFGERQYGANVVYFLCSQWYAVALACSSIIQLKVLDLAGMHPCCFSLVFSFPSSKNLVRAWSSKDVFSTFLRLLLKESRETERQSWRTFYAWQFGIPKISRPSKVTEIWVRSTFECLLKTGKTC